MSRIKIPFSEFNFHFSRSGGAGGQNVNKVNTKVTMYWDPSQSICPAPVVERFRAKYPHLILDDGTVQIVSQKTRNQKDNIDDCIEKLHALLETVALPPKVRKATRPKRSAVLKRLDSKKKDSEKKRLRKNDY